MLHDEESCSSASNQSKKKYAKFTGVTDLHTQENLNKNYIDYEIWMIKGMHELQKTLKNKNKGN